MTDNWVEDMTSGERGVFVDQAGVSLSVGYLASPVPVLAAWHFPNVWTMGFALLGLLFFWHLRVGYKKAKLIQDRSDYDFIRIYVKRFGRELAKEVHTSEFREYERSGGRFAKFR